MKTKGLKLEGSKEKRETQTQWGLSQSRKSKKESNWKALGKIKEKKTNKNPMLISLTAS